MTSKSKSDLATSPIGRLVPISGHDARFGEDYVAEAFIPRDLPDRVELPGTVWMTVSEAMTELADSTPLPASSRTHSSSRGSRPGEKLLAPQLSKGRTRS